MICGGRCQPPSLDTSALPGILAVSSSESRHHATRGTLL